MDNIERLTFFVSAKKIGGMRKAVAISFFGSQVKFAKAIGRAESTVSAYPEILPLGIALITEKVTEGKIRPDYSLYSDALLPPSLRQPSQ